MFSGLSEYLFGSGKDAETTGTVENKEVPMNETETEDDWVLVDVTNDSNKSTPRRSPRNKAGFQSSPQSVPEKPHHMEESWFITPPPCFTAGGHSPQELATSPMENLLIEHPSMSVYHPSQRGSHVRRQLQLQRSQKSNRTVTRRTHNLRVRNAKPPRRAAAIAARVGLEQPLSETVLSEQREERKQQHKNYSRGKVERHNKAFHQQSRSSRRHYSNSMSVSGRHSGAVYKQPR